MGLGGHRAHAGRSPAPPSPPPLLQEREDELRAMARKIRMK